MLMRFTPKSCSIWAFSRETVAGFISRVHSRNPVKSRR